MHSHAFKLPRKYLIRASGQFTHDRKSHMLLLPIFCSIKMDLGKRLPLFNGFFVSSILMTLIAQVFCAPPGFDSQNSATLVPLHAEGQFRSSLFTVTDNAGRLASCVTLFNTCYYQDTLSPTPVLVGFDLTTLGLFIGVTNTTSVAGASYPSFPAFLRSQSVTYNAMQAPTSFEFIFNITNPADGLFAGTVFVMESGPIQNFCIRDSTSDNALVCCLGTPGQSSSCNVRLSNCASRKIHYNNENQTVTVSSATGHVTIPLIPINITHSWADWNVVTLPHVSNLSTTIAVQLKTLDRQNIVTYHAIDSSGPSLSYSCQAAPSILGLNYCFQQDSSGNVVVLGGSSSSDVGLIFGQYFGRLTGYGLPNFPALLFSNSVNWTQRDSNTFSINIVPPWVNELYSVEFGPIVELCVRDVNNTLACCLCTGGSSCATRCQGDTKMCTLSFDDQQHMITLSVQGQSISAPLTVLNSTHSLALWSVDARLSGVTRLVQNITVTRFVG